MVDDVIARLNTDAEYAKWFFGNVFAQEVMRRLGVAELEQGGADDVLAKQLAEACERIAELEEQLAERGRGRREPNPEFVALYNKARDEWLKRPGIPQKLAPVKRRLSAADWEYLLSHNLAGICGALLEGDSDDIKSEDDAIAKFVEQARRKAGLDREARQAVPVSPTPALAGASSSGQAINFDE